MQNTSANPVPVSGTVGIDPANNHVHVDNLPVTQTPVTGNIAVETGATSQILQTGHLTITPAPFNEVVLGAWDLTPYKEVTVYVQYEGTVAPGSQTCLFDAFDLGSDRFSLASDTLSSNTLVQTFDPAPPILQPACINSTAGSVQLHFMVVGRAN